VVNPSALVILLALLTGFILSGLGGCAVSQSGAVYTPWGVWMPNTEHHQTTEKE
jgi:energy-converting hydrogenase Eha subunit G